MSSKDQDPETIMEDTTESSTVPETDVPFWNMNIPPSLHTKECPEYLQYCLKDDRDRAMLSIPDADYHWQTWGEVKDLIKENRIDLFRRAPSDLRRYREYSAKLKREHGSVMDFVMKERLQWGDLDAKGKPFEEASDYKILFNDWPYGIDKRIIHLVVWTKFELAADPESEKGDLSPQTRKLINDFVDKTFVAKCGKQNVIWFKNWTALKSIHAVEHLHVMLFDPDREFVSRITGGDVPLAEKVGKPEAES